MNKQKETKTQPQTLEFPPKKYWRRGRECEGKKKKK
jgi:hypothetical protein